MSDENNRSAPNLHKKYYVVKKNNFECWGTKHFTDYKKYFLLCIILNTEIIKMPQLFNSSIEPDDIRNSILNGNVSGHYKRRHLGAVIASFLSQQHNFDCYAEIEASTNPQPRKAMRLARATQFFATDCAIRSELCISLQFMMQQCNWSLQIFWIAYLLTH